jgi:hypothetical protein
VTKGSIYNITEIFRAELFGLPKKVWYKLLETGDCAHCPSLFQPLSDIKVWEKEKSEEYE